MKSSILNFICNVFVVFSVNVIVVASVGLILGDSLIGSSSLYQLSQGLSYATISQQLIASITLSVIGILLGDERFIKHKSIETRMIFIVLTNFIVVTCFSIVFGWIPFSLNIGWIYYLFLFLLGSLISVYFVIKKYKKEALEYNKCLQEFKERKRGNDYESYRD